MEGGKEGKNPKIWMGFIMLIIFELCLGFSEILCVGEWVIGKRKTAFKGS
jgi:hypothetical protein